MYRGIVLPVHGYALSRYIDIVMYRRIVLPVQGMLFPGTQIQLYTGALYCQFRICSFQVHRYSYVQEHCTSSSGYALFKYIDIVMYRIIVLPVHGYTLSRYIDIVMYMEHSTASSWKYSFQVHRYSYVRSIVLPVHRYTLSRYIDHSYVQEHCTASSWIYSFQIQLCTGNLKC